MSTVITVDGLSKKYILRHQTGSQQYVTLRDVIADTAKTVGRRLFHPLRSHYAISPAREEFWALKDISFEVEQGERIGIIGRNGAGKSTILKILSRIIEPTRGVVRIKGRVASLLEVGTGFHPELTGRENIFLNGAILGMSRAEIKKKFDEIVDFANIERFLDTPVKRYSSGMYGRLAFGVAAHLEAEILIVDEVLAVGDIEFQKKCLEFIRQTRDAVQKTVIFVSHNIDYLRSYFPKGILIENGQVYASGNMSSLLKEYKSLLFTCGTINTFENLNFDGAGIARVTIVVNGNESNLKISAGDNIEIYMEYYIDNRVNRMEIGFSIVEESGVSLFGGNNSHFSKNIPPTSIGKHRVKVTIPNFSLYLNQRIYFNFYFGYINDSYQMFERVIAFDSESCDYYETGKRLSETYCKIIFPDLTMEYL
jgi:homopolymeric O-antigen transport system ATP-binding protein